VDYIVTALKPKEFAALDSQGIIWYLLIQPPPRENLIEYLTSDEREAYVYIVVLPFKPQYV